MAQGAYSQLGDDSDAQALKLAQPIVLRRKESAGGGTRVSG